MWDLWSKASFQSIYPELCSFIICHCETSVFLIPVCRSAGSRWSTFCPTDNKCRKHNWTWTNTHISLRPAHITPDRETERVAELTGWVSLWSRPWWRSRRPDTHNTNSRSYRSQTLRKHIENHNFTIYSPTHQLDKTEISKSVLRFDKDPKSQRSHYKHFSSNVLCIDD